MDVPSASGPGAPVEGSLDAPLPTVPRQRWRLILARAADAPALAGRDLADAWETALEASMLPLHTPAGRARARVAFGAPIPARLAVERELADIVLTEVLPIWRVRDALEGHIPDGWRLVDLHDVWLAGPALAGQVAAADYRIEVAGSDVEAITAAAATILAASALPRERMKGTSSVGYDLRPLLMDVCVADSGPPVSVRTRTRFHPVLGTGRPEEVVAALGDVVGAPLSVEAVARERLMLVGELDGPDDSGAARPG